MTFHQVNIAFPDPLYQQFTRLVPAGDRTKFLTRLAEAGLQQLQLERAMKNTFGAWAKHPHPELRRGTDAYLRRLRRGRSANR